MINHLIWQQNSNDIGNADNLKEIGGWWSSLKGKEVVWQLRLISGDRDPQDLDWQPQKLEIKITLSDRKLNQLLNLLQTTDNLYITSQ